MGAGCAAALKGVTLGQSGLPFFQGEGEMVDPVALCHLFPFLDVALRHEYHLARNKESIRKKTKGSTGSENEFNYFSKPFDFI